MAHQVSGYYPPGEVLHLDRGNGSSALIHLRGALVLSWKCKGVENIYLSSDHIDNYTKSKMFIGGIPICFPQYDTWDRGPIHGFARYKQWSVLEKPSKDSEGNVVASLQVEEDEESKSLWNHKFKIVTRLTLKEKSITQEFIVHNTDSQSFEFKFAYHTYFKVADICSTLVTGLKGLSYRNKLKNYAEENDTEDTIKISGEIVRIYGNASRPVSITSSGEPSRNITLTTSNLPDIAVWNPWIHTEPTEGYDWRDYKQYVCVEAGQMVNPVKLAPGDTFQCNETFTAAV